MLRINSLEELDKYLDNNLGDPIDCFIAFKGSVKSSKSICKIEDGKYSILNEIDDTEDILTSQEIFDEELTHIGKAMKLNSFYTYSLYEIDKRKQVEISNEE